MQENEIRERIEQVKKKIEEAAKKSGRNAEDITLIAVTKTVEVPAILQALQCGIKAVGENRVQELCRKHQQIEHDVDWHLIGHLQTNKIKQVLPFANLIHSVDSLHLLDALEKEALTQNRDVKILLQVNVSGEESKFGISPNQAMNFAECVAGKQKIQLCGLMTVPPPVAQPYENKPYFAKLKQLAFQIEQEHYQHVNMDILSMGMSGDYTAAIEEGATMVRVGTSIFGARIYAANQQ
ncbi:MAG: YggS family pyridoxal phosphate-dependent enzyme [Ruminococcaceae bacterium]|nr:YggS family pyridoxal phosphate-dependent enzyme [Oscillospiraceae bacterium]